MVVVCTRAFLDAETGKLHEVRERFEVAAERLSAINATKYGQLAEEVAEEPPEPVTAPQRARGTRRRKNDKRE